MKILKYLLPLLALPIFCGAFIAFSFLGCNTAKTPHVTVKPVIIEENFVEQDIPPNANKLQAHFIGGHIYFSWIDKEKHTLNILDKSNPSAVFVKKLKNIYWSSYLITAPDTVLILNGYWAEKHSLVFMNMKGDTISQHEIYVNDAGEDIYSFAPPLNYTNSTLYAGTGKHIPDTLPRNEQYKLLYDAPQDAKILIDPMQPELTAVVEGGYFPEFFKDGIDYRCHYFRERIIKGDTIVYSYQCSHNLHMQVENGKLVDIDAHSEYIPGFNPYPEDKINDMGHQKKYAVEEGKYMQLLYDPYRKYFYRLAWHGIPFANEDGTTNEVTQKPWSVIVLDEQLNRVGEVLIDDSRYYLTIHGITKDGLVFRRKTEEGPGKFIADLVILKVEEQE